MKIAGKKVSYYLSRIAVAGFFSIGIFAHCANPMAPQGGPMDSLAPVVVNMTPIYGATNFTGKRIYIEFDEYVKLSNQQKEFFTSPFMKKKPLLLVKGKGVQIEIQDTLQENTTYALNFGSSIQDNNEGNPLNSFRYVFSTGDQVDSMVMSGYTVDAYKKDSMSKTFILFYEAFKDSIPDYDSTVFNAVANAVARAENNGIFVAENLKPVSYRIYAMADNNNNQTYDPGVDDIGFLDTVYNPVDMPGFNIWYDTMRRYVSADPQLYFRMFRDEQFKRQYLAGQARPAQRKLVFSFGAQYPKIESIELAGIKESEITTEYLKPTRDSIALWLSTPAEMVPDTVRGQMIYLKHDSLNILRPDTARIALVWKHQESRQELKDREEKERKRQEAIDKGEEPEKEPNPFKVTVEANPPLNPEKDIPMVFDMPLVSMDSTRISLIRTQDDKKFRVRFRVEQDTANVRRWVIRAPWQSNQNYSLEIPEGVFVNVAGETNDTLKTDFATMDPEKYGTFVFNITGKTPESRYVLQMLDQSGSRVITEIPHASTGQYTFRYVDPGKVRFRVIEDMNDNGVWDKGNLVERLQPERVELYVQADGNEEMESKMGWEFVNDIDMNVLFAPVTMEKVMEQIRKAEEIRVRKYLEEKAKNPTQDQRQQQGSPQSFGGFGGGGFGGGNIRQAF